MRWQDRLRVLGERLTAGEIGTAEYRALSEEILDEADRETGAATLSTEPTESTGSPEPPEPDEPGQQDPPHPTDQPADPSQQSRIHIPRSAAWEAPSGEMTQIVGTQDETTVVPPGTTVDRR